MLTALQVRHKHTQQRIYMNTLASCKLLVSMLAEHGSEHDAQEALQMSEGSVNLRVTRADSRVGNLSTNIILRGRAAGQRLKAAVEVGVKRQRSNAAVEV